MSGILYVVATPIGNLDDVSPRAVEVLRSVSLIACEDTRVTAKLLTRHAIRVRTSSYHEHNEKRRAAALVQKLLDGQDIALVSDAGTPGVSDPGFRLVGEARRRGILVRTVPGPSAVIAALAVSGLPTSSFCFLGFLPTRPAARRKAIESILETPRTTILFE
jgi:16S rRNA (cytidine1402-2'-O)-methyltransferase